jgi:AGZA family xanthine/uracil permease-like MFS transporter
MLIGSQAFQETPRRHAPAIVLALVPHLAAWATNQVNGALTAAGSSVGTLSAEQLATLIANMRNEGVLYSGLTTLGGGSILGGLVLGAIGVFIIDRAFMKAAGFAAAGAVMSFFGFMHGEQIGIGQSPMVAASYLAIAGIFVGCAKLMVVPAAKPFEMDEPHGDEVPA